MSDTNGKRTRASRFPAFVALAAFFSNLHIPRPRIRLKIRNPFKRRQREQPREDTVPPKCESGESRSSVEVTRDSSTHTSPSGRLLERIKRSLRGYHRGRVTTEDQVSYSEVQEIALHHDSSHDLHQLLDSVAETGTNRFSSFEDVPSTTQVHDFVNDAAESCRSTHVLTVAEAGSQNTIRTTSTEIVRDFDQPTCSFLTEEQRETQPDRPRRLEPPQRLHKEPQTCFESSVSDVAFGHVSRVGKPEIGKDDLVEVGVKDVTEIQAKRGKNEYGALGVDEEETACNTSVHTMPPLSSSRSDRQRSIVPSETKEGISILTASRVEGNADDLGNTSVRTFKFQSSSSPSASTIRATVGSASVGIFQRHADIAVHGNDAEENTKNMTAYRVESTAYYTPSGTLRPPPAVVADWVLEDVESFDKEMKCAQHLLSDMIGVLDKDSRSSSTPTSQTIATITTTQEPISTTNRGQCATTSQGQSSSESVTRGTMKDSISSEANSSDLSKERRHATHGHLDNSKQDLSPSGMSDSKNITKVADLSTVSVAYRRRIKLRYALNDLPKSEEYLYEAIIAAEKAEEQKRKSLPVEDAPVGQSTLSTPSSEIAPPGTDGHGMEQENRRAMDIMVKNLGQTAAIPPTGRVAQEELSAEQREAMQLKNSYGYPPPEVLGPNPPEIKSYSARRYQKIRERLRKNIQFEPCPPTDKNWTDILLSGERVKYAKYTDSDFVIKIGHGSFGDVYLGLLDERQPVVIKLFKKGKTRVENIAREATVTLCLSHTRCTAKYLGLVVLPDSDTYLRLGLVLEYIGDTYLNPKYSRFFEILRSEANRIITDRRPLIPRREWLRICCRLTEGLRKIHEKGIIVNDLKCDNLLLNFERRHYNPYVIDFGIAKSVDDEDVYQIPVPEDKWEEFAQHYTHIAPEIYKGGHATFKSDIYALGGILLTIGGIFNFKIRNVGNVCRETEPEKRPTAEGLVAMLRETMKH